jgi:hypothetical protein
MTSYAPRRLLGDTIAELSAGAHGVEGDRLRAIGIYADSIELSVPIEMLLDHRHDELVLIADVPRFRRRTDFDLPPGRLQVRLVAYPTGEAQP